MVEIHSAGTNGNASLVGPRWPSVSQNGSVNHPWASLAWVHLALSDSRGKHMPQTASPGSELTYFKYYMAKTAKQWCRTQPNAAYNSGAEPRIPNEITPGDIPRPVFSPGRNIGHHLIQKNQRNAGVFVFKALILLLPIRKSTLH